MNTHQVPTPQPRPSDRPAPRSAHAIGVPDADDLERSACLLRSALRILARAPTSATVDRLIAQDRQALRGVGVLA